MYVILIQCVLMPFKRMLRARILPLLGLFCLPAIYVVAQGQSHHLVDHVEVNLEIPGQKDSLCLLTFLEDWVIDVEQTSISKRVLQWDSSCSTILRALPLKNGSVQLKNISYEFHLLDPHLVASGNRAFPEPDSMDEPTRMLQEELIALVSKLSDAGKRYPLTNQMLSMIFHEEWSMDPAALEVTKKVRGITPVIWQRRQTKSGDPVNEAETGLPVYYKMELQRLPLRNP
jgi:hypothetical protein